MNYFRIFMDIFFMQYFGDMIRTMQSSGKKGALNKKFKRETPKAPE